MTGSPPYGALAMRVRSIDACEVVLDLGHAGDVLGAEHVLGEAAQAVGDLLEVVAPEHPVVQGAAAAAAQAKLWEQENRAGERAAPTASWRRAWRKTPSWTMAGPHAPLPTPPSPRSYEVPSPPSLSPLCSPGALIFTIRAVLVQFHGAFATVDGRMRAAEEALPLLCMPRVAVDPPCARQ